MSTTTLLIRAATMIVASALPVWAGPSSDVARLAEVIDMYHERASKALVTAAQDPAFMNFVGVDGLRDPAQKSRVEDIMLAVQDRFHVEEMCLIDVDGHEVARVVRGHVAADLSADETGAAFFAPATVLPAYRAYTSDAYLSPDAHAWVVAYATPIIVHGRTVALLHYEHDLTRLQALVVRAAEPGRRVMVVSGDGYVIADSGADITYAEQAGKISQADYFAPFALAGLDVADLQSEVGEGRIVEIATSATNVAFRSVGPWTVVVMGD